MRFIEFSTKVCSFIRRSSSQEQFTIIFLTSFLHIAKCCKHINSICIIAPSIYRSSCLSLRKNSFTMIRRCVSSPKLSFHVSCLIIAVFLLLQIFSFDLSLYPKQQKAEAMKNETLYLVERLRASVTFLPLKDLRFSDKPQEGHTWFMSSFHDKREKGEVQHQEFPSESSNGRLLCLKGNDGHDGSWNYYALAWPEALPSNTDLLEGLTFVSYNHYNYDNLWHGLSAIFPFVAWSLRNKCEEPQRWVLYHWGEIRTKMGHWLTELISATYSKKPEILQLGNERPVCFEKAVVMRHNEGGMSRERRTEVYDLLRCKARTYCNLTVPNPSSNPHIGMTLLMRTGPRSFRNVSAVIGIFRNECERTGICEMIVANSGNLGFCEQVELMSKTDVLVSPHGAQLTNMFLMDKNSSVMEFFPKGWLNLAGVGQFVYQWETNWSGMRHEGAWRDPDGENCTYQENDRRCMSIYKNGRIGCNETYFREWARGVLVRVKERKLEERLKRKRVLRSIHTCQC
ncbi:PREDICTED: uncharacterized protein LOC104807173 [Tarenaya hassleriana]|uniref:uncharacterized protein LOC104807173 n=1 Tax=Tarenaya hassleriana TaxID=28532 RepID=UPI00053C520A|nr:PREDICTED: uncharacterized protein LOC104807173 [Tarenaya hassleriana]